ncbi:MAG: GcrA cell cycle regulator [Defluviimonas sp.]|nr:GcrA cell cycle regulator [Defluviimonas sp.]
MSWTDERVETLKKMWAEGQSASQIAKELGSVTRNAVIGKVHRLGLSNRVGGAAGPEPEPEPKPVAPSRPAEPAAAQRPEAAAPPPAGAPVEDGEDDAPAPGARPDQPRPAPAAAERPAERPAAAPAAPVSVGPARRQIVPAGQPLPPQPSAGEISPEALASVREVEKRARRLTLMELTERTCKWPIGDPATDDFWFCGLGSIPGKPYCEAHVGVAFQPMSARRDRRR